MYSILSLLKRDPSNTLLVFGIDSNLGDVVKYMKENDFTQVVYSLENKYFIIVEERINLVLDRYQSLKDILKLKGLKIQDAVSFSDEQVEVLQSNASAEITLASLRDSLNNNSSRYKSVILSHNNNLYYFNYSDLGFLNKLSID